jgi:hypothetical protein
MLLLFVRPLWILVIVVELGIKVCVGILGHSYILTVIERFILEAKRLSLLVERSTLDIE